MSNEKTDEVKGRVKEAIGSLTDDEELKQEGRIDQAASDLKSKIGDAVDAVRDAVTGKDEDR